MIENDNEFELFAGTLPMDRECFPYRDRILYGGYYTNENQVIIGKSLAKSISNNIKDYSPQQSSHHSLLHILN